MREKIIRNRIRCKKCGDIIESKYTHDFKECSCKSCFVDGGHEYLRRGFVERGCFEDLSEVIFEEESEIKCPQCNKKLKIEYKSKPSIDAAGNEQTEFVGSCESCLADYFWIEIIDSKGNKRTEEFKRYFCG